MCLEATHNPEASTPPGTVVTGSGIKYNFPKTVFADLDRMTVVTQLRKVIEEAKEIEEALDRGDVQHALYEAADTAQALETLWIKHARINGAYRVTALFSKVIVHTRERGYYDSRYFEKKESRHETADIDQHGRSSV